MSYRSFKRLLGETSLERKCRWLLGCGTLILMAASFLVYARLTEDIAYDQLTHTGRTLVSPIVARLHVQNNKELHDGMEDFQALTEQTWPENLQRYQYKLLLPESSKLEERAEGEDANVYRQFQSDSGLRESATPLKKEHLFVYYAAIRAGESCAKCHRDEAKLGGILGTSADARSRATALVLPNLQPGDLMAAVKVQMSTGMIEDGLHTNRAWLIAFAVGSTFLILAGTYIVIRYVVVKPVKILKSTADAIAAGELTVRSDIRTGDEFEDLSQAFNRMLANLIQIQDRNKGLIAELDSKMGELAQINLHLHRTSALKTEFLSTMSHELRTPLVSVIGFSESLLNAENMTEKQRRWLAFIYDNGKHLLSLINDVLDLAKMESGKMRVKSEVLNPATFLEQVAAPFRILAEKKEIELRVEVPEDLPDAKQDRGKLRQIAANLLSNAVKFTPEGGRITLSASIEGENFVLRVADTGVGIAPENREMVFQKFRQTASSLTREQGGTGLGLSIVRELARLLGGDVSLRSEPGLGSTFTVTVIAKLADDPLAALSGE